MSTRYEGREYDRGQNYGRRSDSEYDRSYGERTRGRYGYGRDESESERYAGESKWRGQYGGSYPSRSGREYQSGREGYGSAGSESEPDYMSERERRYGGYGRGYDTEQRYAQQYNYPTGFRSAETYGGHGLYEDYRGRYGRGGGRGYGEERGWWDRASDEVASWFGDEEAERRRRMDEQRQQLRGRGPKGYRRSDERIKEDVNDRLSEGYLDASDVEVAVQNGEVTLTGTVNSRSDKRRAEDIAEYVTGVTNVENRLRVKQSDVSRYSGMETGTSSSTATGTTATARGKTAGS